MRFTAMMLLGLMAMLPTVTAHAQTDAINLQASAGESLAISEVASGLAFPMGMIPLPDGSLLVASSPSPSGNFYNSSGTLLRLDDSDNDGTLDQQTALATELLLMSRESERWLRRMSTTSSSSPARARSRPWSPIPPAC